MSDKIEVGALWRKVSERTGAAYYTGEIKHPETGQTLKVVAFDNDRKQKDTHPDIRLYLQEEKSGSGYQKPAAPNRVKPPETGMVNIDSEIKTPGNQEPVELPTGVKIEDLGGGPDPDNLGF